MPAVGQPKRSMASKVMMRWATLHHMGGGETGEFLASTAFQEILTCRAKQLEVAVEWAKRSAGPPGVLPILGGPIANYGDFNRAKAAARAWSETAKARMPSSESCSEYFPFRPSALEEEKKQHES